MNTSAKTLLTVTLGVSLAIANITAAKLATIPVFGGVAVPAGFLGIAVAFLCSDLIGELYGEQEARGAVNAAIVALVIAWGLVYASLWLPTAPFYADAAAFETVMGASWNIVTASILTLLVSQNVDVSIFHYLKDRTDGRYKFLRNIGSTGISQLVDTALFITLGFVLFPAIGSGTPQALAVATELIIAQYLVKLIIVGMDTPLFYLFTMGANNSP